MPGGGGRKKPFSGKQKKAQLQAKKHQQFERSGSPSLRPDLGDNEGATIISSSSKGSAALNSGFEGSKFFENKLAPSRMNPGRYALTFRAETKEEVMKLKEQARTTIHSVAEEYLECNSEDFYNSALEFPTRPPWKHELTRDELERNESRYFQEYLRKIDENFDKDDLSYFELNLETWRQFWRVLEMSDILLCVVDIRFPPLLFPPRLYDYVCKDLGKQILVVLNKVDLCPPELVLAWKDYFTKSYEGLNVVCFTSYPSYNLHGNTGSTVGGLKKGRRVRGRLKMAAEGAMEVYKVCEKIVEGQVDLTQWKQKIHEEMNTSGQNDDETDEVEVENSEVQHQDTGFYEFKKFHSGILTIGCVGQPNVGKSSLINALMGKKVVSVSKTPGHTKHFQTIFLTPNVRLCDCPGLIFPSKVPKPLQVLCGSYPIAQLKEPYSTVQYLGQRLDLPKILGIQHPEGKDETDWSAFDIADGWALKRGYYTAKASRLDSYRGANHILRLALEGRICLCLRPPGFLAQKAIYNDDPRLEEIISIQAKSTTDSRKINEYIDPDLSDSETESSTPYPMRTANTASGKQQEPEGIKTDDEAKSQKQMPKTFNKFALLGSSDENDDD